MDLAKNRDSTTAPTSTARTTATANSNCAQTLTAQLVNRLTQTPTSSFATSVEKPTPVRVPECGLTMLSTVHTLGRRPSLRKQESSHFRSGRVESIVGAATRTDSVQHAHLYVLASRSGQRTGSHASPSPSWKSRATSLIQRTIVCGIALVISAAAPTSVSPGRRRTMRKARNLDFSLEPMVRSRYRTLPETLPSHLRVSRFKIV